MDWRRWASIARLSIRKIVASMATKNCFAENICLSLPLFRPFRLFVFFRNYNGGRMAFLHEVQFFAGIGPAHFPAVTTRPLGRGCLPFSPLYFRSQKTCRKYTLNILNNQIDRKKTDASSRFSDVYLSYFMSCTGEAYRKQALIPKNTKKTSKHK